LVAWADRLGTVYRKEERVDHFSIWQDGQFVSQEELHEARCCTLAALKAIESTAASENDVSIQQVLPDAGRWSAGVRCVLQTMVGADPELVSAPGYCQYEDSGVDWPVVSGYGDLISRMASGLPIQLGTSVEKLVQRSNSVEVHTTRGTIAAKTAIVTVSTNVLASGLIKFSSGPAADFLEIANDLPCGRYEKVAVSVSTVPPEAIGKIFCMIDPGSGERAIDFQIMEGSPPIVIAHLAGDTAGAAVEEGSAAMVALAIERLTLAFGNDFRRSIAATGTSGWASNPLIRGSYAHARPGAAHKRREAISLETGNVVFAGEALSARWPGAAHGAYQSGRDKATQIAGMVR
jgi:monoamine oxidase